MPRYFIEVAYKGTNYAGFQIQENANTIQAEVEKALAIIFKQVIELTGSSRTDAGVHALQNFFHFDTNLQINNSKCYNLNAVLPQDIVVKSITQVNINSHSRFDAISREYKYHIQLSKNPFKNQYSYFFPYKINFDLLNEAANLLLNHTNYIAFSKKNTQVYTHNCTIYVSFWQINNNELIYTVKANRFLRGMVKALVATMLQVGTKKITIPQFKQILNANSTAKANFSAPSHGLFLVQVNY
jgi:tRNA pseudouridine38-40 synthase